MMQLHTNCYNHINNIAYILCTGSCLKERPWICESCIGNHNKTMIDNVEYLDPLTHAKDKAEFQMIKSYLIEDINKRPLQLQFLLKGYHKIQEILYRIVNYIQLNQKNMQEYVDDYLKRIKEDLKFVSQLNFESVNTEQAEQINKIRQSRFINPSEYYKTTLRRDLYKLIDLYKDALQQTEKQVKDYFQEQPSQIKQQQNKNTQRIVNTTCISLSHDEFYLASGECGETLGRLDIFEIISQNCKAHLQFQDVINAVSFNLKPNQNFIYELAVCTKRYISYCVFNIKDKSLKLQHQIQFNYKKYGEIIKFIFLNQYEYIIIGDKLSYYQNTSLQQQDKIIDTITVTDIDVSLKENQILIGNKQGFVKFQQFKQNDVFSLSQDHETQAHDRQPVVCVKIRQTNDNQQRYLYLTAGQDDLIKIWNFQSDIVCQIKIKCITACFVGNSNLLAIFNKKEFEIGVFYENDEDKQNYERITCKPMNFDQKYLNNTENLQNIGIVLIDNCFIQTITRDNRVNRHLDDAAVCLKFQKKLIRQPLEISQQDTQLNRQSIQPLIQQEFQKQI